MAAASIKNDFFIIKIFMFRIDSTKIQNNEIIVEQPKADIILPIMDKIQRFDKLVNDLKKEKSGIII